MFKNLGNELLYLGKPIVFFTYFTLLPSTHGQGKWHLLPSSMSPACFSTGTLHCEIHRGNGRNEWMIELEGQEKLPSTS
jgi:hypothetical protein